MPDAPLADRLAAAFRNPERYSDIELVAMLSEVRSLCAEVASLRADRDALVDAFRNSRDDALRADGYHYNRAQVVIGWMFDSGVSAIVDRVVAERRAALAQKETTP